MDILALDLATNTGWCRGIPGCECPTFGSINFSGSAGASDAAIGANCLRWLSAMLEPLPRPDLIAIEKMIPAAAKIGDTNRATRDRLAGLRLIVLAVAHLRGVYRVEEYDVRDIRLHFINERKMKRVAAKREVMRTCARIGIGVTNDNEGDAVACWSYACGLIEPVTALRVSPLFQRGVAL